jgi:putative two-component system response regulator
MRVLIADRDANSLEIIGSVLRGAGHEVDFATDGLMALEKVRANSPRLVMAGWELAGMDGVALTRAIRSNQTAGYVYVILLRGQVGSANAIEALSAGADDFLTNPFDPTELTVRVRTAERILSIETRDLVIFAMAKLAESRDPETGAHLDRVRHYSRLLAEELGKTEKYRTIADSNFVRLIFLTSPLHDIGKVAVPDSVLLKPGRLNDREFEIMKLHTTMGTQVLQAALKEHPEAKFLKMAAEIAETHHERWDGTGYPHATKGEEIPLCGRIVALADVYDALTSRRVYKPKLSHETARCMIMDSAGTHFDPDVVAAFARVEEEFLGVRIQYGEMQAEAA